MYKASQIDFMCNRTYSVYLQLVPRAALLNSVTDCVENKKRYLQRVVNYVEDINNFLFVFTSMYIYTGFLKLKLRCTLVDFIS